MKHIRPKPKKYSRLIPTKISVECVPAYWKMKNWYPDAVARLTSRNRDMKRASRCSGTTSLNKYQKTEPTKLLKKEKQTMKTPMVAMSTETTDIWRASPN